MNRELLQELADLLRTVPESEFDMNSWGDAVGDQVTCGTACCMGGHATRIIPELVLRERKSMNGSVYYLYNEETETEEHDAFADAFDLDEDAAWHLTNADAPYVTPEDAADAIERLLNE